MSGRIGKFIRWFLMIWGGLSAAVALFVLYQLGPGNRTKVDSSSVRDVRFVLNGCGLGERRIERVVHSYVSSRSFTGDGLDAYAIKITHFELAELTWNGDEFQRGPHHWYRGDKLPEVLDSAVGFVGTWLAGGEVFWFPKEAELRSGEYYVYPARISCLGGIKPYSVELVFIRPADKMVFYFAGKT